ncbi:minor tail protein [Arthrobacter phage TaylorSipht]|nr:minor tail protein [Arthrobacter phage TaylorSipht]
MADLANFAAAIPAGGVRKYRGIVVTVDGLRLVNVDGQNLRATWADPIVVDDGDVVDVEIINQGQGQSSAHVPSRRTTQPRPATGTVSAVPSSSPVISITAGGLTYDAEFVGSYVVGDKVHLDWGAGRPRVIGKVTTTAAPEPVAVPTPVQTVQTGKTSGSAIESGTFWGPGGWGSWAGGGETVYQGDYGSGPLTGAWFYGKAFGGVKGKTITKVLFRTGRRRPVGASSSPAVFHFRTHSSSYRPGGNVALGAASHDVTIPAGAAPETIELPVSFGAALVNGGGIAIYGSPYAGMVGRLLQSDSGAVSLYWKN